MAKYEHTEAKAMKRLLASCEDLGDVSDVTALGCIASTPLSNAAIVDDIRQQLRNGNWAAGAADYSGDFKTDLVQWLLLARSFHNYMIVEVIFRSELWHDDSVVYLRDLLESEADDVRKCVHDWTQLAPTP